MNERTSGKTTQTDTSSQLNPGKSQGRPNEKHGLEATPTTTGAAQYQSQPGQRELQVELEHLKSLAGKYVTFYANGAKFGAAKVSSLGIVQIDCNTELGQSVPWIVHGSTVNARTSTGVLITHGQF